MGMLGMWGVGEGWDGLVRWKLEGGLGVERKFFFG